jgi:hypothetical protein
VPPAPIPIIDPEKKKAWRDDIRRGAISAVMTAALIFGGGHFGLRMPTEPVGPPAPDEPDTPSPGPAPAPDPDVPQPPAPPTNTTLGKAAVDAFIADRGTKAQASGLGNLFADFATVIEFDGHDKAPNGQPKGQRVQTTLKLAETLQWSGWASGTTFNHEQLRAVIFGELKREGMDMLATLDKTKRAAAVRIFREVGTALVEHAAYLARVEKYQEDLQKHREKRAKDRAKDRRQRVHWESIE